MGTPVKISGLPAGTTPTGAGTEIVPAVQSSSTVRLTLAQIASWMAALAQTLTNKTLSSSTVDNSNTVTLKDANFTLQDDGDTTKQLKWQVSGISAGQTRIITVPDSNTWLPIIPSTHTLGAITAKGSLWGGSAAGTMVEKLVGSDGQALHADSSQTSGLVYIDNPSRPNLLINPNWQIDQINEGALYTFAGGAGTANGPDGWSGLSVGAGTFKVRTLADPDNAALKCLEITCTTADAAIAATDRYQIYTIIEGYDAAALMAGTASAQPITLQFKFKSNVTGVYGIAFQNGASNRRYIGTITVADTSEHEYSVTLTMDTSGTWLYTNGSGLAVILTLAAGSNFQATAGSWGAGAEQTTAAQCNFMSSTSNVAYLKRIQLIPGALVQAYKPADIQRELAKCQRYYEKTWPQGVAVGTADSLGLGAYTQMTAATSIANMICWNHKVSKRAMPTYTYYSDVTGTVGKVRDGQAGADVNVVAYITAVDHAAWYGVLTASIGPITTGHSVANARLS